MKGGFAVCARNVVKEKTSRRKRNRKKLVDSPCFRRHACTYVHICSRLSLLRCWSLPRRSVHKDPYLVVKWGDQEVRTSAKRDSGKDCSWPKEELALIVRTKKQLQEPVQVEVRT